MQSIKKYFFLIVGSAFLISACSQKPSSEKLVDKNTISQEEVSKDSNSAVPPLDSSKKPALPTVPKKSPEEVAKELGLPADALTTSTPELIDPENFTSKQGASSKPDAEALEAMNPSSTKDCDSYEAETLKQICYNAKGLSSQKTQR